MLILMFSIFVNCLDQNTCFQFLYGGGHVPAYIEILFEGIV